tara:strand:- start:462 stop:998 length:537 start_codon:yes stop_codon:yes gene_type:complete
MLENCKRNKRWKMFKMYKNKIKIKKIDIYSFILTLLIFSLDRFSKIYVINLIQLEGSNIFLYDFLNLTLNWNTGIAFGLLSLNASAFYHLISALILLIIIYLIYLMVNADDSGKIIIALIIGGAAGNLYDRITYFAVPDFIDFHIQSFHWFTFNVADIFISLGIFAMILKEFIFRGKI